MAAGEGGTVREDEQRAWKNAAVMKGVGEAGYRTEKAVGARKVQPHSFAERIGLGGLDGEEHSGRVEMGIDGHIVKREMRSCVETGRTGRGELTHTQKDNRAVQKAAHNVA